MDSYSRSLGVSLRKEQFLRGISKVAMPNTPLKFRTRFLRAGAVVGAIQVTIFGSLVLFRDVPTLDMLFVLAVFVPGGFFVLPILNNIHDIDLLIVSLAALLNWAVISVVVAWLTGLRHKARSAR